MKMAIFLTVLTFFGVFSASADDTDSVKQIKTRQAVTPAPKVWDNIISAEYSPENERQQNSNIYYYLDINYLPNSENQFRYFQRVAHTLTSDPGKDDAGKVDVLNPRFMYYYHFAPPADKSYQIALRVSTELGTSDAAREDGIYSINMLRLEFQKKFGFLSVGLRPYFAYWVTQYSTDHLDEVLPKYTVGHNLYLEAQLSRRWSWDLELDTGFRMLQPTDVQSAQVNSTVPLQTAKTSLYMGTEFGYLVSKSFKVRVGYYQFDKFESEGKYAMELFKLDTTRYFLGFDYMF